MDGSLQMGFRQRPSWHVDAVRGAVHPIIPTTTAEVDLWLDADTPDALGLQRSLPDDALKVVAKGEKEDGASASA
jgi:hypothetical protein